MIDTSEQTNGLGFFAQIKRQSSPDYQTLLVSNSLGV
jgi:hypothetical protein